MLCPQRASVRSAGLRPVQTDGRERWLVNWLSLPGSTFEWGARAVCLLTRAGAPQRIKTFICAIAQSEPGSKPAEKSTTVDGPYRSYEDSQDED